jgi:AraC-like DNA-binding protein
MEDLMLTHSFSAGPVSLAYVHEGVKSTETGITLPLLQAELMFRLEGEFSIQLGETVINNPNSIFLGLFTQPMPATVSGRFSVAGLFLRPTGFYQLTGQSVRAFGNQAVAADFIWGDKINQLYEKLPAVSADERLVLIQNFISQQPLYPLHPRVLTALDWLEEAEGGQDLVFRLAKSLKVSEKTIHVDFKREVGLSPVVYQLLCRFQHSIDLLRQSDESLSMLAQELDYFDQAHFIKRFSAFAQMTPGDFRRSARFGGAHDSPHYLPQR